MMIPPAPETVKKSLGSETAEALGRWFQDILETNTVSRDEYRTISPRLDKVESRLEKVEVRLEGLEQDVSELREEFREFRREVTLRFDQMNQNFNERFDRMHQDFNERFDQMNQNFNERFDRLHEFQGSMIKWTVGTLALFGTLITILLTISQFFK